jgi:hypothetical protein
MRQAVWLVRVVTACSDPHASSVAMNRRNGGQPKMPEEKSRRGGSRRPFTPLDVRFGVPWSLVQPR